MRRAGAADPRPGAAPDAPYQDADYSIWMQHAIAKHPPPAVDGKRIKPRYITQIKSRPPTFVLMSSRATKMPESYKRYLMNGIREAFDLGGQPIRLTVKQNRNPFSSEDGE